MQQLSDTQAEDRTADGEQGEVAGAEGLGAEGRSEAPGEVVGTEGLVAERRPEVPGEAEVCEGVAAGREPAAPGGEMAGVFPRNQVIVIGALYREREGAGGGGRRRREVNTLGGRERRYELQTLTPYRDPYALPLLLGSSRVGAALQQVSGGQAMVITGELRLERRIDPRFAARPTDPSDRGLDVRELALVVTGLRPADAAEAEAGGGSAAWVEGRVAEPPRVSRHPSHPGLRFETTTLTVEMVRPSPIPGARASVVEQVSVRVAIPATHPQAGYLRRVGNLVRATGQLDCVLGTRGGAGVDRALGALDAEYTAQAEALAGDQDAMRRLQASYRRRLGGLLDVPQLRVVVAHVEPLAGAEALSERERRRALIAHTERRIARREGISAARERRARLAAGDEEPQRGAGDAAPAEPVPGDAAQLAPLPALAPAGADEAVPVAAPEPAPESAAGQGDPEAAPPAAPPARPRRRIATAAVAAAPGESPEAVTGEQG